MKTSGFCFALLLASLAPSSAQVSVELLMDRAQFVPGEAVPVAVKITNRSGRQLHFGGAPNWVTFDVESPDHIVVKNGEVPMPEAEFTLDSSKYAVTKLVDVAPSFTLARPGNYKITATLHIPDWNGEQSSKARDFDIVEGSALTTVDFGMPVSSTATNAPPEMRRFILEQVQAGDKRSQLRLYLRLTDASASKIFRVIPLGPLLSFSRPEAQLDGRSNLHVLFQDGPRSFSYTVVNPDGEILTHRTYDYTDTRPRLQPDKNGVFGVIGGARRVTPADFPPPIKPEPDAKPPSN